MTNRRSIKTPLYLLAGATLVAACVAVAVRASAPRDADPDPRGEPHADSSSFQPYTTPRSVAKKTPETSSTSPTLTPHERSSARAPRAANARGERARPRQRAGEPALGELIVIGQPDAPAHEDAGALLDNTSEAPPVIARGPMEWMPQLPEHTREAIDVEVEHRQRLVDRALELKQREHDLRKHAGERVQAISRRCYTGLLASDPGAQGKLRIAVDLLAERGVGSIEHVRIVAAVYLKQPQLHTCILDSLQGLRFDTSAMATTKLTTDYGVTLP